MELGGTDYMRFKADLGVPAEGARAAVGIAQEAKALLFSWYVCMNVRSNGVVLSRGGAAIGVGTSQQDRVMACVQPGGSVQDGEVIEACDEAGIAMAFTDERCFRHF